MSGLDIFAIIVLVILLLAAVATPRAATTLKPKRSISVAGWGLCLLALRGRYF